MKQCSSQRLFRRTALAAVAAVSLLLAAPCAANDVHFIHEATSGNSFLHVTQLDHPSINGNPFIRLRIQQVYNPGGGSIGVDQATYFGVAYSSSSERWSIETQDLSLLTVGLKFMVVVGVNDVVHDATAGNTSGNGTEIDDVQLNGMDRGFWNATYFRTRDGSSGPRNPHPIAMEYDDVAEQWSVVNQDFASLPSGGGFFVSGYGEDSDNILTMSEFRERHRSAELNVGGDATYLELDEINNRPDSIFFVTLDATDGVLNPRPVAVGYNNAFGRWYIYNVDGTDMPLDVVYMVNIVDRFLFDDGFESGDLSAWSATVP